MCNTTIPMDNDHRVATILSILEKQHKDATIALNYSTPWELLVAVVLSAQCTDIRVNAVTSSLFAKYRSVAQYAAVPQDVLEADIRPTGFFRNKAMHIREAAALVNTRFDGEVPKTMDELLTLPGVARKTANIILSAGFGVSAGIAVDTHVLRVSQRLRLVPEYSVGGKHPRLFHGPQGETLDFVEDADPVKVERILMTVIPENQWTVISYRLIDHGRALCKAQNPQCGDCPLSGFCPASRV